MATSSKLLVMEVESLSVLLLPDRHRLCSLQIAHLPADTKTRKIAFKSFS